MRAVIQRVAWAQVEVEGRIVGGIEKGLLVYVGVATDDSGEDARWLAGKVANLRIFEDDQGKLNLSVQDARGGVLAVPNFTLLADARRGRRPALVGAAPGEQAEPIHQAFLAALRQQGLEVAGGVFGARMIVRSENVGPVNIVLETPPKQGEQPSI